MVAVAEPGTDAARTCNADGTIPVPFTPEQAAAMLRAVSDDVHYLDALPTEPIP